MAKPRDTVEDLGGEAVVSAETLPILSMATASIPELGSQTPGNAWRGIADLGLKVDWWEVYSVNVGVSGVLGVFPAGGKLFLGLLSLLGGGGIGEGCRRREEDAGEGELHAFCSVVLMG